MKPELNLSKYIKYLNPYKQVLYLRDVTFMYHVLSKSESLNEVDFTRKELLIVLHNLRPVLREIGGSSVKSLRKFLISTEFVKAGSKEKGLTITFWGVNTDKCIHIRKPLPSSKVIIRTCSDYGHSVRIKAIEISPKIMFVLELFDLVEGFLGDYIEIYNNKKKIHSKLYMALWFAKEFFASIALLHFIIFIFCELIAYLQGITQIFGN